ncbi:hypothetical protein NUQ42_06355, partial [Glaesserella parasuis]|nr:hypothetical protein [Glaesserella parasuis]
MNWLCFEKRLREQRKSNKIPLFLKLNRVKKSMRSE